MQALGIVAAILNLLLGIYVVVLFARLIFEYIPMFQPGWRPRGGLVIVAEVIYTVTDPPLRMFRRIVPPIRVGSVSIDLGFTLTLIVCFILMAVARSLMFS